MNDRRFFERTSDGWAGIPRAGYVPDRPTNVVRHTLVGERKETSEAPGPALEMRYFEIPPGAVTRLEKHEHEHYVIVGAGRGHAIVGTAVREVTAQDVVYVGPLEPHQFVNRGTETFGIFCVVSAHRDISQQLSPEEIAVLMASPAGAFADPYGAPLPRPRSSVTS